MLAKVSVICETIDVIAFTLLSVDSLIFLGTIMTEPGIICFSLPHKLFVNFAVSFGERI